MVMSTGHHDLGGNVTVKRATFTGNSATDIVAAVTGKRIRVLSVTVSLSGAGTITFFSNSTAVGALVLKAADPTVVMGCNPDGWFQTAAGEKFAATPSANTMTGFIHYIEI